MKKWTIFVLILWLTVVGLSFCWNLSDKRKDNEQLAHEIARAFFQQVVVSRAWNAGHGGVYVPISENVKPNPYLEDPLRDVTTTDGLKLTKINPAFMTRQVAEIAQLNEHEVQFHITSLNPIRPANVPKTWEAEWLRLFETGIPDKGEFIEQGDHRGYRYMAPLTVKDGCLKCHAKQGYKVGDIRGGISVTLPLFKKESHHALITGYGIAASLGAILIITGGLLLEKKQVQLVTANETLLNEKKELKHTIEKLEAAQNQVSELSGILPICAYCKGIRDDKGYWNTIETYMCEHSEAEFSHGVCDKCMAKVIADELNEDSSG